MEERGLRVNAGKMKTLICGTGQDLLQSSGKFPCAVCALEWAATACALEWAATASSATVASTGCRRNAVVSST